MKNSSEKIRKIISSIIILFSIWQTQEVFANSIIIPQPIFTPQTTATPSQNTPSNKIIQESQNKNPKSTKETKKKTKTTPVKKITNINNTTKPKTVNPTSNTTSRTVNRNSKTKSPKNWERYLTPPIIIITLILVSITGKR
ncbi:MAG: hypothetical protein Q8P62_00550 [Candidatus Peregrinibacteria bacterium]|nr:hypothetical protein [Candidatus Peregrinibacteria bacterium]